MFKQLKDKLGQYICITSSGIMFMFLILEKTGIPSPTNDLLSAIIGIIVALLSIAFPITIGNISERLSVYNNSHIANLFQEESCYRQMKCTIWILILAVALFYFIPAKSTNAQFVLASLIVLLGIVSILIFYKFIIRSTQYMIDTDNVVFKYCKQKLANIRDSNTKTIASLLEILKMCGQIILKKEKSQSYVGIEEISSFMPTIVKNILNDIKITGKEEVDILRNVCINYYDIVFSIWRNSYQDSPETARKIAENYQEVVRYAIGKRTDINAFEPLFFFYQRISSEINSDEARKLSYCKEIPWLWYFDLVFEEGFDLKKLERANMYLLTIIKTVIDNNNDYVFNAFIANTVDGMLGIDEQNYPYGTDDKTSRKLSEIRCKVTTTYTYKDFNSIKELISHISDIQTQKTTYAFVTKCFKYNNIQFLVVLIGAYCLYRKKNEYIKYILYYNQPTYTSTIFVNKDIIPHDINILINWFCNTSRLLMDYSIIWPDHIDLTYWFKKYIAIILCRICKLPNTNFQFDIPNNVSKQYLEYLLFSINELQDLIHDDELKKMYKEDVIKEVSDSLDQIKHQIDGKKKHIEESQKLSDEKINNFKNSVTQSIWNYSIWYKVLHYCNWGNECKKREPKKIKYEVVMDKSFLSENDEGIYIGFDKGISVNIADRIDFYFEHTFFESKKKTLTIDYYNHIDPNTKGFISYFTENDLVVFINYFDLYNLLLEDKGFKWERNDFNLIGKTSKQASIFSFGDPSDRNKRIIILDKRDLSKLSIKIEDFSITDLNNDTTQVDKFINLKPYWLPKTDQRSWLKKQVLISIYGNYSFSSKDEVHIKEILIPK